METSIKTACALVGGQSRMAELLGVSSQAVSKWVRTRLPAQRVLDVERATQGRVTRHELRPDLYPPNDLKYTPLS